jgi:F-type H+/Na+-transporting ATPase subunit alpha
MKVEEQVVSIFAGTRGYLDPIPVEAVGRFEHEMLRTIRDQHAPVLDEIRAAKELKPETEKTLVAALDKFAKAFTA